MGGAVTHAGGPWGRLSHRLSLEVSSSDARTAAGLQIQYWAVVTQGVACIGVRGLQRGLSQRVSLEASSDACVRVGARVGIHILYLYFVFFLAQKYTRGCIL